MANLHSLLAVALAVALTLPAPAQPDTARQEELTIPVPQNIVQNQTERPASSYQSAAWSTIQNSIALLPDALGRPQGLAALIGDDGLFITHASLVNSPLTSATLNSGENIILSVLAIDKETSLVLLQADNWRRPHRNPVRVVRDVRPGEVMLATVNGPVKAQLTSTERPGLFLPSQRYVPLAEIQMESRDFPVGGALLFNNSGELIGVLGATLSYTVSSRALNPAGNFPTTPPRPVVANQRDTSFGPQGLTVGYALGPRVLARVVEGFRSPSRAVRHPSVGLFFRAGPLPGQVIVDRTLPLSPADQAGLQPGDQILTANEKPVQGVVDLASLLFNLDPGDKLTLQILRDNQNLTLTMTVATQPDPRQ